MLAGGSAYQLEQVASVSGQHYAHISIRPRLITLRMAATPISPEGQKNFNLNHPGSDEYPEPFVINADSGQSYYAVVYSRSASETFRNLVTGRIVDAATLGLARESKFQGLGDIHVEPIAADKGQELMRRLRPQP